MCRLTTGSDSGAIYTGPAIVNAITVRGRNTDNGVYYPYEKQGFTGEGEGGTDHRKTDNDPAAPHQRRRPPPRVPHRRGDQAPAQGRPLATGRVRPPRQHH